MLATYVSELHTSSLTQLCDWRICSLRLDEELWEAHLFASEKRPHAATGCGLRSTCNRKTSRWRPQSSAHTPKKPKSRTAAKQGISSLAWRHAGSQTIHEKLLQRGSPDRYGLHGGTWYLWHWLHVAVLLPTNLMWLLHLWIVCAFLLQTILKISMTSRLHYLMHRFVYNILRPHIQ